MSKFIASLLLEQSATHKTSGHHRWGPNNIKAGLAALRGDASMDSDPPGKVPHTVLVEDLPAEGMVEQMVENLNGGIEVFKVY